MFAKLTGLRTKMLLVLAIGMAMMFALIFLVARTSLLQGYAKLEVDKVTIQANSAINLINEQSRQIGLSVRDNAHWDDLYAYVAKPNQAFIDSSFNDAMLVNLKLNAMFIVNNHGEIVSYKGLDHTTGKPWRIPDILMQAVKSGGLLVDPNQSSVSGLFKTPAGICIVSTSDILTSLEKGPRRGTLIMVRLLDSALIEHIEKILGTKLLVEAYRDDEITTISPQLFNKKIIVKPISNNQVAGFALMKEISGDAEILIQTVGDRKIFEQGQISLRFLYWGALIATFLLALFSWIFDKLVLSRIANLNESVKRIGASAVTADRIEEMPGNDELNSLAHGINNMLTKLDESQRALMLEKEQAQVTLTSIADAVITSDVNGCVVYMNTAAEHLTGIDSAQANAKPLAHLFNLTTEDKTTKVDSLWLTNPDSIVDEVLLKRADSQEFIINKSASILRGVNGEIFGTVTVLHDVTLLRAMSNQLSHQARYDSLTGLANRYEFDRKARAAIEDNLTTKQSHCLAFIDLDKFKLVNDSCGHVAGDLLLKKLADHLLVKLRSADMLARLGGDEFALLLIGCKLDKAQVIVANLLKSIQDFRFEYDDKVFKVGASIGLTEISSKQTLNLGEHLANADAACYTAKREGGNCIQVSSANVSDKEDRNKLLSWVSTINVGLENNQFVLFSQSLQGLNKHLEPHCELLIRMKGKDGQLHLPVAFLPAAERYHLMPQIDRWVINEAFSIMAKKGIKCVGVYAINLSGQSLSQDDFLDYVMAKISQYAINTQRICFEITETSVISNLEKAQQFMQALRAIGCRFSLDDFGSGLSSFAYLKNLKVDFLKIDGMFVKSIASNKIDRAMVESINNVGHVMGLHTIGEFAESQDIIEVLKDIGVDYAQGYGVKMPELFE